MPPPTARRTRRIWLAVFDVVELGKDIFFLAVVLVFRLSNFCHDTFQLDIELVDNRLSLSTMASDVDGFREESQLEPSYSFCFDEAGGVWNQTQPARQSVAFSKLCQGTFIECHRRQNALGEFQGAWLGLTSANPVSFVRIEAHTTERRKPNDQNENAKCPDNSFRRGCHASVGSGSRQAWARRPLRFGFTVRPERSV
jgi:hypothetical protein